jgi:UDP-N-acetylglucosamine 1-carboxyvinyltransferase
MGAHTARSDTDLRVTIPDKVNPEAPYELVERMRASIVVLGPLLARHGRARVSMPGGDNFGPRPIDMHLAGLQQLGATIEMAHGNVEASADRLAGSRVVLEFPSHTATDNLMMAATLAEGTPRGSPRWPTWRRSSTAWGRVSPARVPPRSRSRALPSCAPPSTR